MFNQIGVPGIIMLILVLTLVFGSKNLPNIGQSLGSAMREFRESVNGRVEVREEKEVEEK